MSASSDESRSALDEDAQELARFAKDIDIVPVRVSPQDERLAAAAATIARLQPTVARFDSLYLKVTLTPRVFCALNCSCLTRAAAAALDGHYGLEAGCAAATAHPAARRVVQQQVCALNARARILSIGNVVYCSFAASRCCLIGLCT